MDLKILKNLSNLQINDLKNINYQKYLKDLRKKPGVLINLGLIAFALIFSGYTFKKSQHSVKSTRTEISNLENKLKTMETYNETQKTLKDFLDNLPPRITEDDLINLLTDFAQERNIQIESFSPAKRQSSQYYDLSSMILQTRVENYKDLWLFINDIEESPYALRIENWSGSFTGGGRQQGQTSANETIQIVLEIAAINFKNE